MALDNAQFMSELSITDPPGTDPLSEGDDQIRTSKRTQQQSFPNVDAAVTLTTAQLNQAAIKNEGNTFTVAQNFAARVNFSLGTGAAPSFGPNNDTTTGLFFIGGGTVSFSGAGTETFRCSPGVFLPFAEVKTTVDGTALAPAYSFNNNDDMGMYRQGADLLAFATAGAERFRLDVAFTTIRQPVLNVDGTEASPAYSFSNDPTIGMRRAGAGLLKFAVGGADLFTVSAAAIVSIASNHGRDASVSNPTYSWENETNTGLFRSAAGTMAYSSLGVLRWTSSGSGFIATTQIQSENGITCNAQGGASIDFRYLTGGVLRWQMRQEDNDDIQSTEDWVLRRHNDAGAFLGEPFKIQRLTGLISMLELPSNASGLSTGMLWRNGNIVNIV